MTPLSLLNLWLGRSPPENPELWHRWTTVLPVRLTSGRLSALNGQLWRRRVDGGWEYRQDPETDEEWEDRNVSGF